MDARAGVRSVSKDPLFPGILLDQDLSPGSILRGLRLEPLPGLWPRRLDRFGEWPPARGGQGKGEEVVKGKKWFENLEEPTGPSCLQDKGRAGLRWLNGLPVLELLAEWVSLCGWACGVAEKLSLEWNYRTKSGDGGVTSQAERTSALTLASLISP